MTAFPFNLSVQTLTTAAAVTAALLTMPATAYSQNSTACVDTAPIGDGWGWNGIESCRVDGTQQESSTSSQAGDCIDLDGDGWGWDGVQSCSTSGNNGVDSALAPAGNDSANGAPGNEAPSGDVANCTAIPIITHTPGVSLGSSANEVAITRLAPRDCPVPSVRIGVECIQSFANEGNIDGPLTVGSWENECLAAEHSGKDIIITARSICLTIDLDCS